jgi:hypothetical protein
VAGRAQDGSANGHGAPRGAGNGGEAAGSNA